MPLELPPITANKQPSIGAARQPHLNNQFLFLKTPIKTMRDAAKIFVLLTALIVAPLLRAQDAAALAEAEAVKRQEATIRLHQRVLEAQDAEKKHRVVDASKLYQEAYSLAPFAVVGDPRVNADKAAAADGLVRTRVELAERARRNGDLAEAQKQMKGALAVRPQDENLRRMKVELDRIEFESKGQVPNERALAKIPVVQQERIDVGTKVQNGKLLYEMGKLREAEVELREAIKVDPGNKAAFYYLNLIKEADYRNRAAAREEHEKEQILSVESSWLPPHKQETLPVPNPMARTNLVYTTKGRQNIFTKLEAIHLNEVSYDLPLSEVLKTLRDESRKRDPEQRGINFLINPHSDAGVAAAPTDTTNPAQPTPPGVTPTAPVPVAPTTVDLSQVTIKIAPPLSDVTLADVLDAITKVADVPIKYTIEDYAVVFSPRPPEAVALYSKQFHVDPNTFVQGLESVRLMDLSNFGQSGGGGGGRRGGGGGQQQGSPTVEIPSVGLGPISQGRQGGGVQNAQGVGLNFVTRTNSTQTLHEMVRAYFTAAGVNLTDPGKTVFFNDRTGLLLVRASLQDLEVIASAVEMLNQAPPQLTIESKFAEMTQDDSKALGFDWFLGNTTTASGRIGLQGGTAPSFQGNSTAGNPSGIFPGGGVPLGDGTFIPGAGAIGTSAADQLLTSGLRQTYGNNNTIPAVGTVTGILTDPQFRVVIRALEQRAGADLLSAPKVTTLSGRQAHISVLDLVQIVTGVDLSQSSGSTANTTGTANVGVVASQIQYSTDQLPFGPTLDVMPTVSADGYSIQMVLIPTFTEFLGYDNPGQFVPQAQSVGGSTIGIPLTAVLPLPRLRVRQVVTTCNVWDGQTVVLGGLISEDIRKIKDKVPVLGDLPFVGRLFRSESNESSKRNLLVFVTPTIIDPAGNRLHTDEEMPFARTSIPVQSAPANQ
jgi:general secretion pathway protein D